MRVLGVVHVLAPLTLCQRFRCQRVGNAHLERKHLFLGNLGQCDTHHVGHGKAHASQYGGSFVFQRLIDPRPDKCCGSHGKPLLLHWALIVAQ